MKDNRVRDTWSLIADFVGVAGSLEEVKQMVANEIKKGDCFYIQQSIIDQRIEFLWRGKVKSMEMIK